MNTKSINCLFIGIETDVAISGHGSGLLAVQGSWESTWRYCALTQGAPDSSFVAPGTTTIAGLLMLLWWPARPRRRGR